MNNYSTERAVGVAGATGYAGQELVRLLARHPRAALGPVDGLEGLRGRARAACRRWRGSGTAPSSRSTLEGLAADATRCSSRCPKQAVRRARRRRSSTRGVRVFDLSGAFRLRDADARGALVSGTRRTLPAGAVYGLTELHQRRAASRAARRLPRLLSDGRAARAARRSRRRGCSTDDAGIVIDAKSGISGAGKTPSERTHFSECHGSVVGLRRVRSSARRGDRAGAGRRRHVRAAPGAARPRHPRDDLRALRPGTSATRHRRRCTSGVRATRRSCG